MDLQTAGEINGNVARWYMDTIVFGREAALPQYPKSQMLEAFALVKKANGFRGVDDSGEQIIQVVCDPRIADMVVQRRGW